MSSLWAAARSSTRRLTSRRSATASATSSPSASSRCTPSSCGGLEVAHVVGGRDERLARHAVGEHRGAAEPVALDHRDLGAEVRGDQGGLVPTGPPTEDDDSARPRAHSPIQPLRGRPSRRRPPEASVARWCDWPVNGRRTDGAPVTFELRLAQHPEFCSLPVRWSLECERASTTRLPAPADPDPEVHDDPLLHPARRRPRHDRLRRGDRGRLLPAQRRRRDPGRLRLVGRRRREDRHLRRGVRRDGRAGRGREEGGRAQRHRSAAGLGQLRRGHQGLPGEVPRDQDHQRPARRRAAPTRSPPPSGSRASPAPRTCSTSVRPWPWPTPPCSPRTRWRPGRTSATDFKEPTGLWVNDYGGYMGIGYDSAKVPAPTSRRRPAQGRRTRARWR